MNLSSKIRDFISKGQWQEAIVMASLCTEEPVLLDLVRDHWNKAFGHIPRVTDGNKVAIMTWSTYGAYDGTILSHTPTTAVVTQMVWNSKPDQRQKLYEKFYRNLYCYEAALDFTGQKKCEDLPSFWETIECPSEPYAAPSIQWVEAGSVNYLSHSFQPVYGGDYHDTVLTSSRILSESSSFFYLV
jgi:hypothetical protein